MTHQPETARALLWRHGLPEDVIDGALCLHAQELAELQRLRMDELDLTGQKARIVGRIVDLIDPTKTPTASPVGVAPTPDQTAPSHRVGLRDEIAAALEAADYRMDMRRGDLADAVLPVLYREWPWLHAEAEDAAPCRTTQYCAHHGWCHRCAPDFAAVMSRVNVAIQRTEPDEGQWGPLYEAVGKALREVPAAVLPASVDRADEEHRLALSEALGLGTGAPWDAIHERATELGLPPLGQDPVARRLGLVDEHRATVLEEAAAAVATLSDATYVNVAEYPRYDVRQRSALIDAAALLRRLAAAPAAAVGAGAATTPGTETEDAPRRDPHPTQADVDHAMAALARFQGQNNTTPAKET